MTGTSLKSASQHVTHPTQQFSYRTTSTFATKISMKTSQISPVLRSIGILHAMILLAQASSSGDLVVQKACQPAIDKNVCIRTIKSFPESANATIPELAIIILKLASQKVVNVTKHINTLLRNGSNLEPTVYQRIEECSVHLQDAVDMVDNSMAALSVKAYDDVTSFLGVAVGDAAACEDGIKSIGPKELVKELSKFDQAFKRLCNVALVVTKSAKAST